MSASGIVSGRTKCERGVRKESIIVWLAGGGEPNTTRGQNEHIFLSILLLNAF